MKLETWLPIGVSTLALLVSAGSLYFSVLYSSNDGAVVIERSKSGPLSANFELKAYAINSGTTDMYISNYRVLADSYEKIDEPYEYACAGGEIDAQSRPELVAPNGIETVKFSNDNEDEIDLTCLWEYAQVSELPTEGCKTFEESATPEPITTEVRKITFIHRIEGAFGSGDLFDISVPASSLYITKFHAHAQPSRVCETYQNIGQRVPLQ